MKDPYDNDNGEGSSSSSLLSPERKSERKFILDDFDDIPLQHTTLREKRRRWITPLSLGANLLLFVVVLFQLSQPCFFSARTCVYEKRGGDEQKIVGGDAEGLKGGKLMADVNGIVPEFSTEQVVFMNDSRYAHEEMFKSRNSYDKILAQWVGDMPRGRGFVVVHNSSAYPQLQRPWHMRNTPGDGYSIAYLHQYHCLYMILKAHGDLSLGIKDHDHDMARHVTHCFDYLRQGIYCSGDSTLEGKSATEGLDMTDGWGDVHVCKDRKRELEWVVENRFSNKTGIS